MKIRVSHLPPAGLPVQGDLSLESLNARMNEGKDNQIVFTEAPKVDLVVTKTAQGAETKGRISTRYTQSCGRCDEPVEKVLEVEANMILQRKPDPKDGGAHAARPEDYEDDIGISFYEGDVVDLESLLQELLILPLNPFWHPECDQAGKCSHCGKDVEKPGGEETKLQKISLGELLKKAGVSNN